MTLLEAKTAYVYLHGKWKHETCFIMSHEFKISSIVGNLMFNTFIAVTHRHSSCKFELNAPRISYK